MASVYSVGQINAYIKNMFTQDFVLNRISVKGEVSNCKYHSSGHIYFTIKDESGTLAAVMFARNRGGLDFTMTDGMKVVVSGSINVYERDGKYQLYANKITLDGEGDLYKRYLKLRNELEEMGMFAPEYKKPIPRISFKVGIVTAKTGAAVQDIINISRRRNPYVELYLYSAIVQGEQAVRSIVEGIARLDAMNLDVLIVGRGGGSIEDLWAFNEEAVARAIFNCNTPVISAVGHETDFTIADFVADLRAPTPSAAAELAVCDIRQIENEIYNNNLMLNQAMEDIISRYRQRLENRSITLKYLNPVNKVYENRQYTTALWDKLQEAMQKELTKKRHYVSVMAERLNGLSPLLKLSQGYSYTENDRGEPVTDIHQVEEGDRLFVTVKNGKIEAKADKIHKMSVKK